ncbi:MAG: type II toxin-antitoxin system prevent-host-death family antitoxin [Gemmatimonadaceae bacterium]
MATTGIRELKNNLSLYLRRVAAGEHIVVTAHGRPVAELRPPDSVLPAAMHGIRRAVVQGDPFAGWHRLGVRLPRGSASVLLDEERGDR